MIAYPKTPLKMPDGMNFGKIASLWKDDKKNYIKESSMAAYTLLLDNHLLPRFEDCSEISEKDVQDMVNLKLGEGLSIKTVKGMLIVLKMILKFGYKYGLCNYVPFDVKFPTNTENSEIEVMTLTNQRKMMEYLKPYDVALEAWSPLAEGRHGIVKNKTLVTIGEKYGKTAAQVALRFLVQNGVIIIPKTTHIERMQENIDLFDFTLSDDDMKAIQRLDTGHNVTGWPSDALTYQV
jgi:hypothetical protein